MKTIFALCIASILFVSLQAAPPAKKDAKPEKVDPVAFMKKFDTDNDGKLDKTELSAGLKTLRQNNVTTKNDSWKKFDEDGDGKISLTELKRLLDENHSDKPDLVTADAFMKKFDTNKDGSLDNFELSTGLKSLKPNSLTAKSDFWKRFDDNNDGKLSLKELGKLLDEYNK